MADQEPRRQSSDEDGLLPWDVRRNILAIMERLGIDQRALAERVRTDAGQISRLLNRKSMVRLDSLQRIARALRVPLGQLFEPNEDEEVETLDEYYKWQRRMNSLNMDHVARVYRGALARGGLIPASEVNPEAAEREREVFLELQHGSVGAAEADASPEKTARPKRRKTLTGGTE